MYHVAITGASGPVMGLRLIEELLHHGKDVGAVVSPDARITMGHELFGGNPVPDTIDEMFKALGKEVKTGQLHEYQPHDFFTPLASGTAPFKAMIIVPCSMKTLAAVAHGYSDSLVTRGADVALKEGRPLILVPRETPLSLVHIENLGAVKRAGADIVMPVPGFYTFPKSVDDVIDFIVGKILNLLDIEHDLFPRWGE